MHQILACPRRALVSHASVHHRATVQFTAVYSVLSFWLARLSVKLSLEELWHVGCYVYFPYNIIVPRLCDTLVTRERCVQRSRFTCWAPCRGLEQNEEQSPRKCQCFSSCQYLADYVHLSSLSFYLSCPYIYPSTPVLSARMPFIVGLQCLSVLLKILWPPFRICLQIMLIFHHVFLSFDLIMPLYFFQIHNLRETGYHRMYFILSYHIKILHETYVSCKYFGYYTHLLCGIQLILYK